MHDILLPSLESTYQKNQTPMSPGMPKFPTPTAPTAPAFPAVPNVPAVPAPTAPTLPPAPPEPEQTYPFSPLLPRVLPTSPNITVPANPLLPPDFQTILDYEGLQYLNGYLRTQINNYVEVEFLVGSTNITSKSGKLIGVGLNYILLEDLKTGDITASDFYNIKFVRTEAGDGTLPVK